MQVQGGGAADARHAAVHRPAAQAHWGERAHAAPGGGPQRAAHVPRPDPVLRERQRCACAMLRSVACTAKTLILRRIIWLNVLALNYCCST
jgi:hypothetical protein